MSYSIPENHVRQFKANVRLLSQQKNSRLRRTVRDDGDIVGDRVHFDRIGATEATRITNRHGDTQLANSEHSRRTAYMYGYEYAELVDKQDKLKTLYDPQNYYAMNGRSAMGRAFDDEIITALGGNAYEDVDGSTSIALPPSQKIAVNDHTYDTATGDANLTISKLMVARDIIYGADVDEDLKLYCVATQKMLSGLLSDQDYRIADIDYNTVKALVNGEINTMLGIEFVRSQRLLTDSSSNRLGYIYTENAIGCGVPEDINVSIDKRPDKKNSMQVYVEMHTGAVRIEDEQVVEIACAGG